MYNQPLSYLLGPPGGPCNACGDPLCSSPADAYPSPCVKLQRGTWGSFSAHYIGHMAVVRGGEENLTKIFQYIICQLISVDFSIFQYISVYISILNYILVYYSSC